MHDLGRVSSVRRPQGLSRTWRPRASLLSSRYTTCLSEIVHVRSW
nr:DUF4113 domain-containing protein [Gluconobacter cerinus]